MRRPSRSGVSVIRVGIARSRVQGRVVASAATIHRVSVPMARWMRRACASVFESAPLTDSLSRPVRTCNPTVNVVHPILPVSHGVLGAGGGGPGCRAASPPLRDSRRRRLRARSCGCRWRFKKFTAHGPLACGCSPRILPVRQFSTPTRSIRSDSFRLDPSASRRSSATGEDAWWRWR